jgi:acyl carrier protein
MGDDVLVKVRAVLKELVGVDPQSISLETKAFDVPGWDSVGHLSLCGALEEAFGIQFDASDLAPIDSVSTIVSAINTKKRLPAGT